MTVAHKVNETIAKHNLLAQGDSVLVALSGGPDSVALLHILHQLGRRLKLKLYAIYINHNIRKKAAKEEERFCRELCAGLNIELVIVSEDIPALAKSMGKGVEETGRDFRYAAFDNLAREEKINKIALGHHADDRVETVLFRIIRGTGKTGLAGIPIKRDKIIRPLYELTKQEILDYLKENKQPYCLDESNRSIEYDRNYIRNKLLVDIRHNLNPQIDKALLTLSEISAEEESFLQAFVKRRAGKLIRRTPGDKIELDLGAYNTYDKWFRRRLLRYCLTALSGGESGFDRIVVDRLDDFCRLRGKSLSLPDGFQAVTADNKLVVYRRHTDSYDVTLSPGKTSQLTTLRLNFRMSVIDTGKDALSRKRRAGTVYLAKEKVTPPVVVRNIRPGDRFRPLGLKGTKKVGDYLTDRKVHRVFRDEVPVVCDKKGIVWLVGFEIADRVKIESSSGKVLKIECVKRSKS